MTQSIDTGVTPATDAESIVNSPGQPQQAAPRQARSRITAPPTDRGFVDPEQQLHDELSDDRIINLRADMGEQFLDSVALPNLGDLWIPGYRLITEPLAREVGLTAALEDDPFPDLPPDQPQPSTGAVDGNVVAAFTDGLTGTQKVDVLNSMLLAELASNLKYDRTKNPVEWTSYYATVLANIGWVTPSQQWRSMRSTAARFTISAVILKIIEGFLTGDALDTVKAAMDAMKALESQDRRLVIFERNNHSQGNGNFQVNGVGASSQGTLSMQLTGYNFQTNTNVTNVLWFSFSNNETNFAALKTTVVLNEQVFSRLRDALVTKLGNRGLDYIAGLQI